MCVRSAKENFCFFSQLTNFDKRSQSWSCWSQGREGARGGRNMKLGSPPPLVAPLDTFHVLKLIFKHQTLDWLNVVLLFHSFWTSLYQSQITKKLRKSKLSKFCEMVFHLLVWLVWVRGDINSLARKNWS